MILQRGDRPPVEFVDPATLTVDRRNVRSASSLDALVASVAAHGVLSVCNATPRRVLVAGAHRCQAATQAGEHVPVVWCPELGAAAFDLALMTDNRLGEFTAQPELEVEEGDERLDDPRWSIGVLGRHRTLLSELSTPNRLRLDFAARSASRGVVGSIVADPTTRIVVDGWPWACLAAVTGQPVPVRWHHSPIDVPSAASWVFDDDTLPHPAEGRWGVKGSHRRLSPLWQRILAEGEPGAVLDIGCGHGWHLGQLRPPWRVIGYEPYRRRRGAQGDIDRAWVRSSIRRVATHVADRGLFDHAVLDHVLFLTGRDDLAEAAVAAAATLLTADGTCWVSNYWHDLKSSGAVLDDGNRRVNTSRGHRYVVRRWPREEMDVLLGRHFGEVTMTHAGESHLYRCTRPLTSDPAAVRTEFDLEWPDGSRPGVVDELLEVIPWRTAS